MPSARIKGLTWVEIGIVVAILSIVAGTASVVWLRHLRHKRERYWACVCQENLIRIEGAVDQWAVENNKPMDTTVTMRSLVRSGLLKTVPRCPAGGNYDQVFTVGESVECGYTSPAWFDAQGEKYLHRIHATY